MDDSSGDNRRTHERFPLETPLEIRPLGGLSWTRARALDVSVSGLGFEMDESLQVGDYIRIGLPHPQGSFHLNAIVRHVRAHRGAFVVGAQRAP